MWKMHLLPCIFMRKNNTNLSIKSEHIKEIGSTLVNFPLKVVYFRWGTTEYVTHIHTHVAYLQPGVIESLMPPQDYGCEEHLQQL